MGLWSLPLQTIVKETSDPKIESLFENIKIYNEHFGAENFTEGDKLFVDQIQDDMMNDETLAKQALLIV